MKLNLNKKTVIISACFAITMIYGMLLLMISYTNHQLATITGIKITQSIILALPQSLGLIVGTACLWWMLKHMNVRNFLMPMYFVTIICLALLSQIDHLTGSYDDSSGASAHTKALICFCILSFIFGLSISASSPATIILLSAVSKGKQQVMLTTASGGLYCIGAGILPLVLAKVIISDNSVTSFATVRYFYYIALGFAVLALICAYFMNYRHKQTTLLKTADMTNNPNIKTFNQHFYPILFMILGLFVFYMGMETIVNYGINTFYSNGHINLSRHKTIIIIMAGGLFFLIQGFSRLLCSFTLIRWMTFRNFIIASAFFIIAGFIVLLANPFENNINLVFLASAFFGIGVGGLFYVIYSYSVQICDEKAALIGIIGNVCSMFMIPFTQLLSFLVFRYDTKNGELIIKILGLLFIIFCALLVTLFSFYLRKINFKHQDEQVDAKFIDIHRVEKIVKMKVKIAKLKVKKTKSK